MFYRILQVSVVLCLIVVMMGAWVRLSDAGLGCPDWPGCYGQLIGVPEGHERVNQANEAFPHRPVESHKAWKEMIHRYAAGTLGLLVLSLAVIGIRYRKSPGQQVLLPCLLLCLVIFQALLGMWTVTLLLKPAVVSAHLLGGMTTLALLWLMLLRERKYLQGLQVRQRSWLKTWATTGLVFVIIQISLGAWTSTNYAGLACPDFPQCQGQIWPQGNPGEAFRVWGEVGINYEYGLLGNNDRMLVNMTHRLGAAITTLVLLNLMILMVISTNPVLRYLALGFLAVLAAQVSIGLSLVFMQLPLVLAVAHNGGAALLLLMILTVNHAVWYSRDA